MIRSAERWDRLAQYIEAVHSAYAFVFDRELYRLEKEDTLQREQMEHFLVEERKREEKEEENYLTQQGIVTETEKDAYSVAWTWGNRLNHVAYRGNKFDPSIEVLEGKGLIVREIAMPRDSFYRHVHNGLIGAISTLEDKYWLQLRGVKKPQIINPDFREKAYHWLCAEIERKLSPGLEIRLLDHVLARNDGERIALKTINHSRLMKWE
ncbi:hypothetical protein HY495_00535 [Candidatus Woesearchaeota archaeon]|nr:hypothetical protein [Candidatus Woesearchaeota archaeon]